MHNRKRGRVRSKRIARLPFCSGPLVSSLPDTLDRRYFGSVMSGTKHVELPVEMRTPVAEASQAQDT